MTKEEAIKAMSEGKKVRHRYFSPDEWMAQLPNGDYDIMPLVECESIDKKYGLIKFGEYTDT